MPARWLAAARDEDDAVALVIAQKCKPFHHPRIETVAGVSRDLTCYVKAVLEPG
jgi:hypothetical protein